MAGMVRRIRALAATPKDRANSMHATGTMPLMSYQVLLNRPPNAEVRGSNDQAVSSPMTSAPSAIAPKISAILLEIQRSGLTDWVQSQAMGAGFVLAGHQRGADEQPGQDGQHDQRAGDRGNGVELPSHRFERFRAVPVGVQAVRESQGAGPVACDAPQNGQADDRHGEDDGPQRRLGRGADATSTRS